MLRVHLKSFYVVPRKISCYVLQAEIEGFHGALVAKNPLASAGDRRDAALNHGSGESSGGGHGNSLKYTCQENLWTEEPGKLQFIRLQSQIQLNQLKTYTQAQQYTLKIQNQKNKSQVTNFLDIYECQKKSKGKEII